MSKQARTVSHPHQRATTGPEALGFRSGNRGTHTSRTMMLAELQSLLSTCPAHSSRVQYRQAIETDNLLGKKTATTRHKTFKHLSELYALDSSIPLFRVLRLLWNARPEGQPLLALLSACARDPVLASTADLIINTPPGKTVTQDALAHEISTKANDRFSTVTLSAAARNTGSSWTQSGHLQGKLTKVRARPVVTPANAAYALFLGHLSGASGQMLFRTVWARLLDVSENQLHGLAAEASRHGWITFKQAGNIVEVRFPNLLTPAEEEVRRGTH
jgi:hypothetical protein